MNVDLGIWTKLTRVVVLLLAAAGILGVIVWYQPLIRNNENLRKKIQELETKVHQEDLANRRLELSIKALKENPRAVERVAREKLNLARPGETVFRFEESTPSVSSIPSSKPEAPGR